MKFGGDSSLKVTSRFWMAISFLGIGRFSIVALAGLMMQQLIS
jgi:hypothetical protein